MDKQLGELCWHRRNERPFTALSGHFNGVRHIQLTIVDVNERDTSQSDIKCWK